MNETSTVADFFNGPYFLDTPKGRFHIIVEPSLCMAFGSCETLAPKVFLVEKNKRVNPKAKVECETCADYEKIHAACGNLPDKGDQDHRQVYGRADVSLVDLNCCKILPAS